MLILFSNCDKIDLQIKIFEFLTEQRYDGVLFFILFVDVFREL